MMKSQDSAVTLSAPETPLSADNFHDMFHEFFTPANRDHEGHLERFEFRIIVFESMSSCHPTHSKRSGEKK